jgi:hypothetical protein
MDNQKAFDMIEGRFSDHVKRFHSVEVSESDSDTYYWSVKERLELARTALDRAPKLTVTTLPRSLGDVYRAVRNNLTKEELSRYNDLNEQLEALSDDYGL